MQKQKTAETNRRHRSPSITNTYDKIKQKCEQRYNITHNATIIQTTFSILSEHRIAQN